MSYPMNRRYRVSVPSMRSVMNFCSAGGSGDMTHDLYLLAAVFTLLVIESHEPAGKPMTFDEGRPAGRAVRVLVPGVVNIAGIRIFQAEVFCFLIDSFQGCNGCCHTGHHFIIGMKC